MTMSFPLPSDKSSRRDLHGLLLVVMALLLYLLGPLKNNLDNQPMVLAEVFPVNQWAGIQTDTGCGIDPSQAIFLMKPIDLNRADAMILSSLPGIGPELAERIVAYREMVGEFKEVAGIIGVRGVGPRKLATIVADVTVCQYLD